MAKVAHSTPAAVPHRAAEGRSPRSGQGPASGQPVSLASGAGRPPAAVSVRAFKALPAHHIAPPDLPQARGVGLPDLADRLHRAGLELPAPLLQAHADAIGSLLNDEPQAVPPARTAHAAATLDTVYRAFLDRLPSGQAAAEPRYQDVASSLMAHALLINQVERARSVPADLDGFLGATFEWPPTRLHSALSRSAG